MSGVFQPKPGTELRPAQQPLVVMTACSGSTGISWRHPHHEQLLEQLPALDFIEVHSENFFAEGGVALALLQARSRYPVSLHGVGLGLGSACGIDGWHLDQLARLVERIEPIRVSDHVCFARGHLPGHATRPAYVADLLPIPFNRAALEVMSGNVQRFQDRLGRPLLVENLSAYITMPDSDCDETSFLGELARQTGCGLLIDVNNIYVNALNLQLSGGLADLEAFCRAWIDNIPPHAVGELHVAGHQHCGDIVIDDHGSRVDEAVWSLCRRALQRFGNVPVLVEWDTSVSPLQVLLNEVARARGLTVAIEALA